ncbi:MAG: hypothetical protein ACOYMG_14580 [Candidatus Methylumidiphilus sp.]
MSQRVLNINNTQIVSGTEVMTPGEGGEHTRLLWASVPPFASQPDITISIYSDESKLNPYPEGESNPGTTFAPWSIEYVPQGAAGGRDLLAISATNTETGAASPVRVVCSYLAIGESN